MSPRRKKKNWLEWLVFTVGLVLVTAVVGYLVYDMATAPKGPARLAIELAEGEHREGRYVVPVTVKNHGHEVVEGVEIEVDLVQSDGRMETGHFVIPHLPVGATRRGSVAFENSPEDATQLVPRVAGYQTP